MVAKPLTNWPPDPSSAVTKSPMTVPGTSGLKKFRIVIGMLQRAPEYCQDVAWPTFRTFANRLRACSGWDQCWCRVPEFHGWQRGARVQHVGAEVG